VENEKLGEIEVTEKMIAAGLSALFEQGSAGEPGEWTVERIFRAMCAAAKSRNEKRTV
jgi:hypothetical protein